VQAALAKQRAAAAAANLQHAQKGPNTAPQLSATIEREKANIARQEKLLEDARRRLAAAEEKLRDMPQPVTPQEPK
jgi:predicted  nucleic acid-binding Zn-ribbon protein